MDTQKENSSQTERAIQFSRTKPPRSLVPVNYNHVGAHNELLPCTKYEPEYSKLIKRVKKSIVHQRRTSYDDPNRARETPLHPPFMNYDDSSIQGKSLMSTGPLAF